MVDKVFTDPLQVGELVGLGALGMVLARGIIAAMRDGMGEIRDAIRENTHVTTTISTQQAVMSEKLDMLSERRRYWRDEANLTPRMPRERANGNTRATDARTAEQQQQQQQHSSNTEAKA